MSFGEHDRLVVGECSVTGELDIASAPAFRLLLRTAMVLSPLGVVVDLFGVTFIDCSGLRPLLEARIVLGSDLRLRSPSTSVLNLLRLAELEGRFTIEDELGTGRLDEPAGQPAA